jgi:E3 ubiquitin-protein ligase HERC3
MSASDRRSGSLMPRTASVAVSGVLVAALSQGCNERNLPEELEIPDPVEIVRRDLATGYHTCRTDGEGGVRCVCHRSLCDHPDAIGYPGYPDRRSVALGSVAPVQRLVIGTAHTCTLHEDGRVKCWGRNDHGQLGLGHTDDVGEDASEMGEALAFVDLGADFRAIALDTGFHQTCAVSGAGRVKCWGRNVQGSLGVGDDETRGDEPGEMGDALPYVDLGSDARAIDLTVGLRFACALLEDGGVKCWGRNEFGQLGLAESGDRGDGPAQMGDALPYVDLGTNVRARGISAGEDHVCAVLDEGRLKCWGRGAYFLLDDYVEGHAPRPPEDEYYAAGRLGLGDPHHRGRATDSMGDNLPFVDVGSDAFVIGVALGATHTCAALRNGRLKCWGSGRLLGLEDTLDRGDAPGEMGDDLPYVELGEGRRVVALSTLSFISGHTCVLLEDDTIKCWGYTGGPGSEPGTMGDALQPIDL